jgi:hypothetical protein
MDQQWFKRSKRKDNENLGDGTDLERKRLDGFAQRLMNEVEACQSITLRIPILQTGLQSNEATSKIAEPPSPAQIHKTVRKR